MIVMQLSPVVVSRSTRVESSKMRAGARESKKTARKLSRLVKKNRFLFARKERKISEVMKPNFRS
jgi:hypothetical protein